MSRSALKGLQAAAGAAGGGPVYVDDVFSNFRYQGNDNTHQIVNGIDLAGKGGLVWQKARSTYSANHLLTDTVRGRTKYLSSNLDSAEATANDTHIASFNNDGFTLGSGYTAYENFSGIIDGIMSWTFRKQPGFFDIVTYTGTGDTTGGSPTHRNIPHNLGVAPGMIITKRLDSAQNWYTWHRGVADDSAYFASTGFINLTSDFGGYQGFATNANQTSTHFAVRQNSDTADQTNRLGATYVAYLFAHDAQEFGENEDEAIIKCGSYTGNGSSTGPIIDLGFEPQWLIIKKSSGAAGWYMYDNIRGVATGGNDALLYADLSQLEQNNQNIVDFTSTGFQIVNADGDINANGASHIYMAIRRPHKPASEFAATDLFNTVQGASSTANPGFNLGFAPDMAWEKEINGTSGHYIGSRITGTSYMFTDSSGSEAQSAAITWDYMNGWIDYFTNMNLFNAWGFKRAPGFFDVVAYTGSGSQSTVVKHNLGVVPEMVWRKRRDNTKSWYIWASALSGAGTAQANGNFYAFSSSHGFPTGEYFTGDSQFAHLTPPTATEFTQGTLYQSSEKYVTYLFASVAGLSKIGTYTGTGNDINVDCGFSAGARFVMVKRSDTSSTGDWYLWDSVRGIVAGNDPYLLLNTTAAQVTNTDYIDPLSSGFTITSSAPAAINASGGTYLFYAIA